MKAILHSVTIILSFVFVFAWEQLLSGFTIQALAGLIAIYLIIVFVRRKRKKNQNPVTEGIPDIFILNSAIFLIISITNQIYSPVFFLLYFLGFGITFIFEPFTVFIFIIGAVLVLIPQALTNNSIESYIRLGSLVLISPLAFFFGQEYKDRDKEEEEIVKMEERSEEAGKEIAKEVEDVIKSEKEHLKSEDVEKLDKILEEAEDLRSETQDEK